MYSKLSKTLIDIYIIYIYIYNHKINIDIQYIITSKTIVIHKNHTY